MHRTLFPDAPLPSRRALAIASALVTATPLVAAVGCSSEAAGPGGASGVNIGSASEGAVSAGDSGGSVDPSAGSGVTNGNASSVSGGNQMSGDGGLDSGGTPTTAGGDTGGGTTEPCVDVEPPPDPEWPDATCAKWAAETEACSEAWFAEYCDASCGRCDPGGSGGTPEPCVDVEPPPDPEWPEANCTRWAAETEACGEAWFADYCDASCGRCQPEGDTSEPPEEECVDTPPPYDPEWPDATCQAWRDEADACNEPWFAEYCDVTCRRCEPPGGFPEEPMAPDCSGEGLPNVVGGEGHATRYWDCCQTHCGQFTGHKCSEDGTSITGDQTSSCQGGGSFACYDEAPRAISECLSYGHIAKANPSCGQCFRIQFTGEGEYNANDPGSKLIQGKQMIVKVTNTGSDVGGNQFDLMVPGGGVGQFNACSRQWGTNDLGAQYGGFLAECTGTHEQKKECVRQECMKIPAGDARDGCLWFVDWFQVADNPRFTSQPTDCPF